MWSQSLLKLKTSTERDREETHMEREREREREETHMEREREEREIKTSQHSFRTLL